MSRKPMSADVRAMKMIARALTELGNFPKSLRPRIMRGVASELRIDDYQTIAEFIEPLTREPEAQWYAVGMATGEQPELEQELKNLGGTMRYGALVSYPLLPESAKVLVRQAFVAQRVQG